VLISCINIEDKQIIVKHNISPTMLDRSNSSSLKGL
jgi:hypothetical protein